MTEIPCEEKVEDSIGNIGNDCSEIVQKTMFRKVIYVAPWAPVNNAHWSRVRTGGLTCGQVFDPEDRWCCFRSGKRYELTEGPVEPFGRGGKWGATISPVLYIGVRQGVKKRTGMKGRKKSRKTRNQGRRGHLLSPCFTPRTFICSYKHLSVISVLTSEKIELQKRKTNIIS